jgi:hypothetical protein
MDFTNGLSLISIIILIKQYKDILNINKYDEEKSYLN